MIKLFLRSLFLLLFATIANAQSNSDTAELNKTFKQVKWRSIGPFRGGRSNTAVGVTSNPMVYYMGTTGGGLWKTEDMGLSWNNISDGFFKTATVGGIAVAESDPNIVYVGMGEHAVRGVMTHHGDGMYKSTDAGKTWKKIGLDATHHIARVVVDPKNPNILYAASHQRMRQEWTYVGGGPESRLYKSTDGGTTWKEINDGLPKENMGRVGIAVSPADPNYVYAIVEARYDKGGVYLSTNKGESWSKQGSFNTSGNYYQEIMCDPFNKQKVFAMDTYLHHSEDGGKTFKSTGETNKHVDNHCIWIDPDNTNHWLVGCDGGLYETYTHASEWKYYANLPIIQFYKATTDNASPFYNIFGGTQDNNSMGGPAATNNAAGILNSDWYITNGGDGFESATDWSNVNITYAQAQYGWLVRYDKASGEKVPIQPMPAKGQPGYRWNWDAPLLVSKHDASTLYFAANKVFKSANKGDDWTEISPDLTRQLDRNKVPVMGQVWSIDAVMKNASTTVYGNVVALDESPIKKGVIYAGTDDGLIQVSQNEGKDWKKIDAIPGVPAQTRVNMLTASRFNDQVVYAAFNNQRNGDFKPYLFKSSDRGTTWTSISSNLPDRGTVYCIKQDFKTPNLLFVGTEFGAYFTTDEGQHWTKLSGLPTIAVYDLEIQERECDLVAATFGRGFYVLDNYSPLRDLTAELLNKKAHMFDTEDALLYVPADPLGLEGTGFQGHNMWASENPSFGAVFNFYLKDDIQSLKSKRQDKEKTLEKDKKDVNYPTMNELRAELQETQATCIWVISNDAGKEIKRFTTTPSKGISRITWNLRSNPTTTVNGGNNGFLVPAGKYSLRVYLVGDKGIDTLVSQHVFNVKALNNQTLVEKNLEVLNTFRKEVAEVSRKVSGVGEIIQEFATQLGLVETALLNYPNTDISMLREVKRLSLGLDSCKLIMYGDELLTKHEFESAPSLTGRLGMVEYMLYDNTTGVTNTHRSNLAAVKEEYAGVSSRIKQMLTLFYGIEERLAQVPIPYTKSRGLLWKED